MKAIKRILFLCTLLLVSFTACSGDQIPKPGNPLDSWPHAPTAKNTPSSSASAMPVKLTPLSLQEGQKINETAYAIAQAVAQQHEDVLLVMDGRLVRSDMVAFVPQGNGEGIFEQLWLAKGEFEDNGSYALPGLAYTFAVRKRAVDMEAKDMRELGEAVAEVFALSAKYLLAPVSEESDPPEKFLFVDVTLTMSSVTPPDGPFGQRDLDMPASHALVRDMRAEAKKGDQADWIAFIAKRNNPRFPHVIYK